MEPMTDELLETGEEYAISSIKLSKDLKAAAQALQESQVRYIVDRYYQLQRDRTRADNQAREEQTPNLLLTFSRDHAWKLETTLKLAMKYYALSRPEGQWLMSLCGVGPVLSAGFLAHLDITKAKTAGAFWRFAGLDPTVAWDSKGVVRKFVEEQIDAANGDLQEAVRFCANTKGRNPDGLLLIATTKPDGSEKKLTADSLTKALSRQPWNARLKTLCWKFGDSMVKQKGRDACFYGHIYAKRKALEVARNVAGENADAAAAILKAKNYSRDTVAKAAYHEGRLPDGHVDMRARRVTEKLFLSHLFQVMYETTYQQEAPIPYVFKFKDHDFAHCLRPPGWGGVSDPKQ
jgi:hypothetical protein